MSSRDEFEAWYMDNWGFTEDDIETLFERSPDCPEDYYRLGVRLAHHSWQSATSTLEAKCAALAAENASLNEKMNKLATWPGIEFYSSAWEFNNSDGNAALEFMCDVQTPSTDAFLAEVRAQGVEMLLSYLPPCYVARADIVKFAAHLRQDANTAELVAAGIITKVGE